MELKNAIKAALKDSGQLIPEIKEVYITNLLKVSGDCFIHVWTDDKLYVNTGRNKARCITQTAIVGILAHQDTEPDLLETATANVEEILFTNKRLISEAAPEGFLLKPANITQRESGDIAIATGKTYNYHRITMECKFWG